MAAPLSQIRTVGVVGGGTAGYFAALGLKRAFPQLRVTLIESSSIPIIGVGEATTPVMLPFLHDQLGIDVHDFYREVKPTWKLGIRFEWLPEGGYFNYPFGDLGGTLESLHYDTVRSCSLQSMFMSVDRTPLLTEPDGSVRSLLPRLAFAYHLDNKRFVAYLAKYAVSQGIEYVDATISAGELAADGSGLECLRTQDGRALKFDLYVDCSGFRSMLIERALGSPFTSWEKSLYCDTAVVADVPHGGLLRPYTTAESMEAGWCWRIPQVEEDHRGYVHCSAFKTIEEAAAEMRAKNPGMGDYWTVRFRSGRHRDFWKGNVVAIGNAYAFVEPLESTALGMVIIEVGRLNQGLKDLFAGADAEKTQRSVNEQVGDHWDFLRWFLALHYRFCTRYDNAFWRECREKADVSGLQGEIEAYREGGLIALQDKRFANYPDPVFRLNGIDVMLAGQQVPSRLQPPRVPREEWMAKHAERQAMVDRALLQRDALDVLAREPKMLAASVDSPVAWYRQEVLRAFWENDSTVDLSVAGAR